MLRIPGVWCSFFSLSIKVTLTRQIGRLVPQAEQALIPEQDFATPCTEDQRHCINCRGLSVTVIVDSKLKALVSRPIRESKTYRNQRLLS